MNRDSTQSASTATLVAAMAAGDDRALGELYDAYGPIAYGLAYAIAGTHALAERVVAEAFSEAWRGASRFEASRTSVLAWITSLVRRKALDAGARGQDEDVRWGGGESKVTRPTAMGKALRTLTAPQQRAIELSYFRGLTVGEIAAQIGAPESDARELLRSAMQDLRSALSSRTNFEEHVVTRA